MNHRAPNAGAVRGVNEVMRRISWSDTPADNERQRAGCCRKRLVRAVRAQLSDKSI